MKNWIKNLQIYYKTAFISAISLVAVMLITLFLYFIGYHDVPNGIALGGLVGILSYLILGLVEGKDARNKRSVGAIIVSIMRFILLATVLVLSAYMYFKLEYHIFNPFAVVGGYLISLVVLIILVRKESKNVSNNA